MKKTKLILNLLAVVFLAGAVPAVAAAELHLIPWPARITQQDGQFALNDQMIFDQSRSGYAFNELKELNDKNTSGLQFIISNDHVELAIQLVYIFS